jgi:hypothetical protein
MSQQQAFNGAGDCVKVSASATSTNVSLGAATMPRAITLRAFNGSSAMAHFRTGLGAQTAVLTDTFLAPGSTETFIVPASHTDVAVILSAGSGSVYFQRGSGM